MVGISKTWYIHNGMETIHFVMYCNEIQMKIVRIMSNSEMYSSNVKHEHSFCVSNSNLTC